MKKWTNEYYTTIAIYMLLVLLATLLFFFAILNFGIIWDTFLFLLFATKSVAFGVLISLILFPLCNLLERGLGSFAEKRLHRTWQGKSLRITAVSLSYLVAVAFVGIVVVSALPLLYQNYAELQATLTRYVNSLLQLLQKNEYIYEWIVSLVGASGQTAQEFINNLLLQYSAYLSSFAGDLMNILTNIITITSDMIVALILSFYFLLARGNIAGLTRKIAAAVLPERFRQWVARFFHRLYTNVIEFLSARLLCSILLGVLCYQLPWALNLAFNPLLSLIVFILNIIPFFGPLLAAALCTVIVFIVQPEVAWLFMLILLLINLTEQYLIERCLLSKRLRPSAGVILVSVILFNHFFGFAGAIFAVPIWVTVAAEAGRLLNRRLQKKGLASAAAEAQTEEPPQDTPQEVGAQDSAAADEEPDVPEYEATWHGFRQLCARIWRRTKAFFAFLFKKRNKKQK